MTDNLTHDQACEIVLAVEMADINAQELGGGVGVTAPPTQAADVVHKVSKESQQNQDRRQAVGKQYAKCFRCGGSYSPHMCRYKTEKCFCCNKIGHISKVCRITRKKKDERKICRCTR